MAAMARSSQIRAMLCEAVARAAMPAPMAARRTNRHGKSQRRPAFDVHESFVPARANKLVGAVGGRCFFNYSIICAKIIPMTKNNGGKTVAGIGRARTEEFNGSSTNAVESCAMI